MKRFILALAPLALIASGGCATMGSITPAPLTQTIADEKALTLAASTVDTLALSFSAMVKGHLITAGSPTALTIADALADARQWVNVAAAARKVGNSASYGEAMAGADAALAKVRTAIGG